MFNINLRGVNPFIERESVSVQSPKPLPVVVTNRDNFVSFTASNVRASYAPFLTFKGIHPDAVLGVETKIVGISNYQKNAEAVKFRLLARNKRGEKEKIQLRLEREPENKNNKNAVAVYHDYKGKQMKLGYLHDKMADELAPLIDKGFKFQPSVILSAGGIGQGIRGYKSPYAGIRLRLEYLSNPDRSPNKRSVKQVRQAFKRCIANGSTVDIHVASGKTIAMREEPVYPSKKYKNATKMKVDRERGETTFYRHGWKQMDGNLAKPAELHNRRNHTQPKDFIEHSKKAVESLVEKLKSK